MFLLKWPLFLNLFFVWLSLSKMGYIFNSFVDFFLFVSFFMSHLKSGTYSSAWFWLNMIWSSLNKGGIFTPSILLIFKSSFGISSTIFFLSAVILSLINCLWIIFIWFVSESVVFMGCLSLWAMATKGGYLFLLYLIVLFFIYLFFYLFWGFNFF